MNFRPTAFYFVSTFLTVVSIHASAADTGINDKEIVLGSCSALSGPVKDYGIQEVGGAKAFLDYINNEKGGVHGRKIRLVTQDDQYEGDRAIECYNNLLKEGVFATGFFVGTPTSAKYVVMSEEKRIPAIGFATGASFLYEPFKSHVFSFRATYGDEVGAEIEHAWKELGVRRFGLIMQDDAFGSAAMTGTNQALAKLGGALVATASYPRNTLDVDPAIARVRAADPETLILAATYASAAEIAKRAAAAGWRPRIFLLAGREAYIKQAGPASEGTVWAQMMPETTETRLPGVALYLNIMKKYAPQISPDIKSLEGFVHARLLVEGLNRAGKDLTRDRLVSALETINDLDLGLGPEFHATYTPKKHQANDQMYFVVVRKGKPVRIKDWKELR